MQPTAVNSLAAIVAAPPPQASDATANSADDSTQGQQFSQLLNDSGKQSSGQQSGQQAVAAKILQASAASSALSAQEVTTPAEQIAQLLAQREQMVTPDDAKDLLKRVDKVMAQTNDPTDTQALTQIKSQLQDIVTSGTPKSVGAILDGAPAVDDAKLSLVGLTALLTTKKPDAESTDQVASEDEEESSAAANQAAAMTVFRPDAGKDKTNAPTAKADPKKETVKKADTTADATSATRTPDANTTDASAATTNAAATGLVTVMIPLAASITQPAAVAASGAAGASDISIKDTMTPAALNPRSDLDQVVPPLSADEGEDVLPQVNLPKSGDAAAADKAATSIQDAAAASSAATATKAGDAKQASLATDAKAPSDLTAINNLSQTVGAVPTQTAGAVQSVATVQTPGFVNHAPVTDQVSVAVSKASKDGISDITIQLDPAGLGRVEVNMHTGHDGQTQISFTVDKADTFDNLSRDARTLERSLQEAGIKADTGSMQFNMRQQPQPQFHSDMSNGQGQRSQQQASTQDDSGKASTTNVASISPTITNNYIVNVREGVDISA